MVKYPNGKNINLDSKKRIIKNSLNIKSSSSYIASNRGMTLEHDIDITNKYYISTKKANIHKKPTPIQVVKVDYPKRTKAKITEAYYKTPSTTDYNGVYKGYYIDFEAKETKNKTTFLLANIHEHQIKHLEDIVYHKGIAFFIIKFIVYDEVYILSAEYVINKYRAQEKNIKYEEIKENGLLCRQGYNPRIDYLSCIDQLINKRGVEFEQ